MSLQKSAVLGFFLLTGAGCIAMAQTPADAPAPNTASGTAGSAPQCPEGYVQSPNDVPPPDLKPSMDTARQAMSQGRAHVSHAAALPLAEGGDPAAQFLVGTQFMTGCGATVDKPAAFYWLLKAAQNGNAFAARNVSMAYTRGEGTTPSDADAFKWMLVAAQSGNPPSQVDLSLMYLTGRGVPQNVSEGLRWTIKGAEQGNAGGLFNIAMAYRNGQGLPKDMSSAVMWEQAAMDRANAVQKTRYQPIIDGDKAQFSVDDVEKLRAQARAWKPGPGSLADVLALVEKNAKPDR